MLSKWKEGKGLALPADLLCWESGLQAWVQADLQNETRTPITTVGINRGHKRSHEPECGCLFLPPNVAQGNHSKHLDKSRLTWSRQWANGDKKKRRGYCSRSGETSSQNHKHNTWTFSGFWLNKPTVKSYSENTQGILNMNRVMTILKTYD